jgi:AraC-like DNA-binding protein
MRKKEGFNGQRAIMIPRKILTLQCTKNEVINECYITDIGYYPQASHHYRKRNPGIDQNILVYCVEGKGWFECNNVKLQISAGNFFIVPANLAHAYGADINNPWTIYWLHFKGKVANAMCFSIISKLNGYRGLVKYSDQRISFFDEMYLNLQRGYSHDHIVYANLCLPHFFASFRFDEKFSFSQTEIPRDTAGLAIDFMQQHLHGKLTLAEMASHVNLSTSHFAAIFQKATGFAPIEYFNHLKIQRACQHLQFTSERIKEISAAVGIEDSYYFSRLFKKMIGISPLQYRERLATATM